MRLRPTIPRLTALALLCATAAAAQPAQKLIVAPYDPARPHAPRRALITLSDQASSPASGAYGGASYGAAAPAPAPHTPTHQSAWGVPAPATPPGTQTAPYAAPAPAPYAAPAPAPYAAPAPAPYAAPAPAPYAAPAPAPAPYAAPVPAPYAAPAPAPYAAPAPAPAPYATPAQAPYTAPAPAPAPYSAPAPVPAAAPLAAPAPAPPSTGTSTGPPTSGLTVDSSSDDMDNPFAAAREEYVAEQAEAEAEAVDTRHVPKTMAKPLGLPLPPERACKTASGGGASSGASIEGVGLSPDEIRSTLSGFLPRVGKCLPGGTRGTFNLEADFNVACTGRVEQVDLLEIDGLPGSVAYCIEDALLSAPFPPHDQAGGALFTMPLQFSGNY